MATASSSKKTSWTALEGRLGGLLRAPGDAGFLDRVRDTLARVGELLEGQTDELIFRILRHDHSRPANAGIAQSLHAAALCGVLAGRLAWAPEKVTSLMGAALTMNLSIIDLQGELAARGEAPTEEQRQQIGSHPGDSAQMLRAAGLEDADWLETVEQHHERPGGGGYPAQLQEPTEPARLLRLVDRFIAKHSPRAGRTTVPADQAARALFLESQTDPLVHLLIKELGIYPPGCYVRLANGEVGVVVHAGAVANKPQVAAFMTPAGDVLARPHVRDAAMPAFAVAGTVPDSAVRVTLSVDKLYAKL